MAKRSNKITVASGGVSTRVTAGLGVQRPASWFRGDWFWGLFLIGSIILTYIPVWQAGFIWDDDAVLTANPCIVGPLGLKEIWTTSAADICPLVLTTYWVEHALWGLEPLPFHLVNVLLHAACAVLLWRVLRSLRVQGAWLGAAFWALHPVQVESVAWITEMKNTESGLFFLVSILFFIKWLRAKELDGSSGGGWNYALALIFAALAMASKSSTVILPVVLCLCAWWVEGKWYWRNVARVVPLFLMSIAASALSIWTQGLQLATVADPRWARTWPERLATAGDAVWFYLGKLLWPHPLITIYPRWQIDAGQWVSYLPLLAVIVVLSIFWLKRELWSGACFLAFAYFVVALLPVLGLVDNPIFRYSLVFDHFQYLASIAPLALAGTGLVRFLDFVVPKKLWLPSTFAALLLILGMVSWQRTWAYAGQETLWTETLAQNPESWLAHNTIGLIFFSRGQLDEAVTQFQNVLEIYPNFADAHCNLGSALLQRGQPDEGTAEFRKALEINPNLAEAHSNLGNAFLQKGQLEKAVGEFQKALEINPNFADSHCYLGNALLQKGQLDEALVQFRKALEINPRSFTTHYNVGNALLQNGQLDQAIIQFQTALEINPSFADARCNLGSALLQKGQLDQAVAQFRKALEINPSSFATHYNLGNALFEKGRLDQTIAEFQEALRLKPDFSPAQDHLAKVQALVRQKEGH